MLAAIATPHDSGRLASWTDRIYNMIAGTAPVAALSPTRVAEYEEREHEWTGKPDFKWLSGFGLIKGMLGGLLFGPKSKVVAARFEAMRAASLVAAHALRRLWLLTRPLERLLERGSPLPQIELT